MSRRDEILRDIKRIEVDIEALEDYRFALESNFRPAVDRVRIWRAINVFLTLRQIDRQVFQLELRLNAARNCYQHLQGYQKRRPIGTCR